LPSEFNHALVLTRFYLLSWARASSFLFSFLSLRQLDLNGDGCITLDEFVTAVTARNAGLAVDQAKAWRAIITVLDAGYVHQTACDVSS